MMKKIIYLIAGFILGTCISTAFAKYEASNNDAAPIVGYGYNGTTLVPILVDSNGTLQIN